MKEMEKMKNKREEKRAQNSEIRIKRAQVMWGTWAGSAQAHLTGKQSPVAGPSRCCLASGVASGVMGHLLAFLSIAVSCIFTVGAVAVVSP